MLLIPRVLAATNLIFLIEGTCILTLWQGLKSHLSPAIPAKTKLQVKQLNSFPHLQVGCFLWKVGLLINNQHQQRVTYALMRLGHLFVVETSESVSKQTLQIQLEGLLVRELISIAPC